MNGWVVAACLWFPSQGWSAAPGAPAEHRASLVQAVLLEDNAARLALIRKLADSSDPLVEQALMAWREGALFIHEFSEDKKVLFLLAATTDADGKAQAIQLLDGGILKGADEQTLLFLPSDLSPVDTDAKLRRAIKATLGRQLGGNHFRGLGHRRDGSDFAALPRRGLGKDHRPDRPHFVPPPAAAEELEKRWQT